MLVFLNPIFFQKSNQKGSMCYLYLSAYIIFVSNVVVSQKELPIPAWFRGRWGDWWNLFHRDHKSTLRPENVEKHQRLLTKDPLSMETIKES